ncbi:MAG: SusC/RagA family TonB-linked outer membrane protein, partial [Rikenellaceae bacterium]|nr:SusC/RagA family TonB-linked outer membrane protein [Rikenellaceae bacterium]
MKLKIYILTALLFLGAEMAWAQTVLTGNVTENNNGKRVPLPGANVNLMNAQNRSIGGTIAGQDGNYRLVVPANERNLTLVYSFIGMESQSIPYTGQQTQNVHLLPSVENIEEVEVYGRRIERNDMGISQREMVNATQKVSMEELIATSPVTSIEEALQGALGGLDIITGGGDPGARSSMRIRGTNSLNTSAEPLIIIDGVPYNTDIDDDFDFSTANDEDLSVLLNISPADIESIEVLKDAAATAIWGSLGGNGVLVITTKKGTVGKTSFQYSSKFTAKFEPNTIPMLHGNEYTALMQEAIWNSANYVGLGNSSTYLNLLFNTPEIGYDPDWTYFNEYNQDTDWLKEITKTPAFTYDNSFSMRGGGDRARYYFSLNHVREDGTTINNSKKTLGTSLNISYDFSSRLTFDVDFSYSQADHDTAWNGGTETTRSEAFKKMPNKSPYYIDPQTGERTDTYFSRQAANSFEGEFTVSSKKASNFNPLAMVNDSFNKTLSREARIKFNLTYKILPDLRYQGWVYLKASTSKNRKFLPQSATGVIWTNTYANQSSDALSDALDMQTENKITYIKYWDNHSLIANGVFRTRQILKSSYGSVTYGNASSGLSDPIVGSSVEDIASADSESRSYQGIGLVNYSYKGRYVAQASMTVEGNSAMGRSRRTAYFPAFGLSWNMQEEPFLERTQKWLDEVKIRASYGRSGKSPDGTYYLGAYTSLGEYMDMSAVSPARMQLNDLRWETTSEYDLGLDLSFFHSRVRFNADWYHKTTDDLLQSSVTIPSSTGYASIRYFNSGKVMNTGWEVRTDLIMAQNKQWRVSGWANVSRNKNEVKSLPKNMVQENYSFGNGNYAILVEENRPLGSFYGYRYEGVYQNHDATYARDAEGNIMSDVNGNAIVMKNGTATVYPGDAKYQDINYDGVINEYDIVYVGNYMPILTTGAGFSVRWKDMLQLSGTFHGRFGQKIINSTRMDNEAMHNINNQSRSTLRRWRNEGDDTDIPRALYNEGYNYLGSDRFVEDASYFRLKSLSLTYYFPKALCSRWGINTLNVFVTGYNLATWTKYKGQDPEVSIPSSATKLATDSSLAPATIRVSCGLN